MNKSPLRKENVAAMMLMASAMMGGGMPGMGKCAREKPERPCLQCGTRHSHNNSFCSADCCRAWKEKKKQGGSQ
jgi:hypothetical protein